MNDQHTEQGLHGVYNILATPFTPSFEVDVDSLRRLTEAQVNIGVDGITILGVASEAQKLTSEERTLVTTIVQDAVGDRVPIIVGTSGAGTEATIAASRTAQDAGAAGVMISPPNNMQFGPSLIEHYRRTASSISIPIVLQDYTAVTGVNMSPTQMAELIAAVPQIRTIKLESTPTPQRTHKTLALLDGTTTVVGGLGGVYFIDELRRGSSGVMTGFAYSEILIEIWRSWSGGDREKAIETYHQYLPILVLEGQPGIGLAIRKEILKRRGFISCSVVRQPGPQLDEAIASDLSEVIAGLDLTTTYDGFSA